MSSSCYEQLERCGIVFITFLLLQLSFAWDKPETADGLMWLKLPKPGNSGKRLQKILALCVKILILYDMTTVDVHSIRFLKRRALKHSGLFHGELRNYTSITVVLGP